VLVPSYDIEKQLPIFFKSEKARLNADWDFPMRQVARATSAAPTYFPPEKITTADPLQYYALIDGGIIANNPSMCAYAEAIKMGRAGDGVLIASIGTGELRHPIKYEDANRWGQLEWAQPVIDVALQGSSETVDYQLQQLLNATGPNQSYYRFQPSLTQDAQEMDNATDANVKHLLDLTEDYLSNPDIRESLDQLCGQLTM
jgi:patatin-like phospholipase/acyl hydrolase